MSRVAVEFLGEVTEVPDGREFTIGRAGDLVIDDNPRLHRRFLVISSAGEMWWLSNVGSQIAATITVDSGLTQTWLGPGGAMPIADGRSEVRFSAGRTTYEFEIFASDIQPRPVTATDDGDGTKTHLVAVSLSEHQRLVVLALAQFALRGADIGRARIPSTQTVVAQLGWTKRAFERALDEVCKKLSDAGVVGLVGQHGALAHDRRARLVEYAITTRMVRSEDLSMLGTATHRQPPR